VDQIDLNSMSVRELLRHYAHVIDALKDRKIVRSKNNPVGDYAEWLVTTSLGWELAEKSMSGYDAVDDAEVRYQIKARRLTPDNSSVQLGAIRKLDEKPFDFLIGIIFEQDFTVKYAAKIPCEEVGQFATYRPHVNAHIMQFRQKLLEHPSVVDITNQLRD